MLYNFKFNSVQSVFFPPKERFCGPGGQLCNIDEGLYHHDEENLWSLTLNSKQKKQLNYLLDQIKLDRVNAVCYEVYLVLFRDYILENTQARTRIKICVEI